MYVFRIILLLCVVIQPLPGLGAEDWRLEVNNKGIKVYQKQQLNFEFKQNKGVMAVKAKPAMVFALLNDFKKCHQWIYGCISGQRQADGSIYVVFKGPPFFKNREVVLSSTVEYFHETNQWLVEVNNVPNRQVNDKHVQVNQMQASWLLTEITATELMVEHTFYIDPNVSIKIGVDKYNRRAMYKTLLNMQDMLKKPEYQAKQKLPYSIQQLRN